MLPSDRLETEPNGLFGEDARYVTQVYLWGMRALHQMAVSGREENVSRPSQRLLSLKSMSCD